MPQQKVHEEHSDSIISICKMIEENRPFVAEALSKNTTDIDEPFLCFFTNYVRSILNVERAFIAEVNYEEGYSETICESLAPGIKSFKGKYPLVDFKVMLEMASKDNYLQFVIRDAEDHIEEYNLRQVEGKSKYYPLPSRSLVWTALFILNSEGKLEYVGNLGVNQSTAVNWSEQDCEFLESMAKQISDYLIINGMDFARQVTCSQVEKISKLDFEKLSLFKENQVEILRLAVQGVSNVEIADKIGYSVKNVEYHLKQIYDKAGVRKRIELVRWFIENVKSE
jgi:DNA-binding CsgD family transcriptional regulator